MDTTIGPDHHAERTLAIPPVAVLLLEVAALRVQVRALRAEVADLTARLTTLARADAT